jgi:hypothetical protein
LNVLTWHYIMKLDTDRCYSMLNHWADYSWTVSVYISYQLDFFVGFFWGGGVGFVSLWEILFINFHLEILELFWKRVIFFNFIKRQPHLLLEWNNLKDCPFTPPHILGTRRDTAYTLNTSDSNMLNSMNSSGKLKKKKIMAYMSMYHSTGNECLLNHCL